MKAAILAVLMLAAVSLFCQPKASSAKDEKTATQTTPTPTSPDSDRKTAAETEGAKRSSPHWYTSSEWMLVIIAALTGFAIAYQAREMAKTTAVMERQTGILVEYNKATRESADATAKSAAATERTVALLEKQVNVMISKERARLTIDVSPLELPKDASWPISVNYKVRLIGPTAAIIVNTEADVVLSNSPEPIDQSIMYPLYLPAIISPSDPPQEGRHFATPSGEIMNDILAIKRDQKFVHFWGAIHYRCLENDYWTRFRWVWKFNDAIRVLGGDERWGNWHGGSTEDNNKT
jgi:hypothetical protein